MAISPAPSDRAPTIVAFGEGAALVDLGLESAADRAPRTHALAATLRARLPFADVVAGAGSVLVVGAERAAITAALAAGAIDASALPPPRVHAIAAVYDGPDLDAAAQALGLPVADLVAIHSGREHTAELLGFLPGFAYLGPLDPRIVLPRRPSPRAVVPAGSVAIAGSFTGVYPFASPGGWHLIARAIGHDPFDPERDPPSLFAPGDRVRFVPTEADAAAPARAEPLRIQAPIDHGLVVVAAQVGATVQDAGRSGRLAEGLPPSGALDGATLAAANAAVCNDAGAAAIEIPLGALTIEARGAQVVSLDGAPAVRLETGDRFVVTPNERAVRYLAVRGGVGVPRVIGSRATLLVARLGGLEGRPLRRGDVLPVLQGEGEGAEPRGDAGASREADAARSQDGSEEDEPLAIDPGPHPDRFPAAALDVLLEATWTVSRLGDRVGVRLEGAKIPRDRPDLALPLPMRRGAVQIATDGTPIVLGPDHPATGGYPVLAILRREAQWRLGRKRPGSPVRFRLAR